ncbi:MAG TPA: PH domain-containing protein [Terriglobia bacterium]|nr:PH domain-containing protein [Terriglobia bacterium]
MTETFPMVPAASRGLIVVIPIAVVFALVAALLFYLIYAPGHVRFEVSQGQLRVRGDIYRRKIPLSDLDLSQAKVVDLTMDENLRPRKRTNGTGMPGYSAGWFRLASGSKALLFVTDRKQVVVVPDRKGWLLLMSVSDPGRFLDALRHADH